MMSIFDSKALRRIEKEIGEIILSFNSYSGLSGKKTFLVNNAFIVKRDKIGQSSKWFDCIQTLLRNDIPLPKFLAYWSDDIFEYFLSEFVPGVPLNTLPNIERNYYFHELSEILYRIHTIPCCGYGRIINDCRGMYRLWKDFISNFHSYKKSHMIIVPSIISWSDYRTISKAVDTIAEKKFDPVLLHGDYIEQNIIVNNGKIAAVVDWDNLTSGDPLLEFAHLCLQQNLSLDIHPIVKHYPNQSLFTQMTSERDLILYQLFSGFITLNVLNTLGHPLNNIPEKLHSLCHRV